MIEISNLRFRYTRSTFELRIPRLHAVAGEKIALVGPSGSGKTTLLQLVAGILVPAEGSVRVDQTEVSRLGEAARRDFRIARVGQVFQRFELVEYLRVRDNILLPFYINRSLSLNSGVYRAAQSMAETLGLGDKLNRWIGQLSQGEQQRVAICRALLTQPPLLLADEPTGSLDPCNKQRIIELLYQQCQASGATMLVVTHDAGILGGFDRVIDFEQFQAEAA